MADRPKKLTATVWRSGHITIPKAIREHMGVGPGDWIEMKLENDDTITIRRAGPPVGEQRRRAGK